MIRRIFNSIQPNLNDSLLFVFFCDWYTTGTSLLTNGTESVFHREREKKKKKGNDSKDSIASDLFNTIRNINAY